MKPIMRVVETAVYVDDLDRAENFCRDVLGLEVLAKEPGRHVFFRVGGCVLLLFNPDEALKNTHPPPHGARGPGHFALGVAADELDAWRQRLQEHGVAIEREIDWPRGGHSIYFRDPANNLAELVTPGIWGLPSGW